MAPRGSESLGVSWVPSSYWCGEWRESDGVTDEAPEPIPQRVEFEVGPRKERTPAIQDVVVRYGGWPIGRLVAGPLGWTGVCESCDWSGAPITNEGRAQMGVDKHFVQAHSKVCMAVVAEEAERTKLDSSSKLGQE